MKKLEKTAEEGIQTQDSERKEVYQKLSELYEKAQRIRGYATLKS